ncbi:hypothetical protein PLICRDRAFT_43046 [Plicaturopsis crispa FD-325 SS-3]|nr:hypothetical protein PLICRDRAFT_43046 [Plicaturopsis crispa FD-325 SS-3]
MGNPRPRHVLIVGGGASGLVALRNFLQRGDFDRVELVERRDDVGGVWYLDKPPDASRSKSRRPRWPSPAYPNLIGNVLPRFLSFSEYPFPPPPGSPRQPYPTLVETHAYLKAFAAPLQSHIKLNTEVASVDETEGGRWSVVLREWSEAGEASEREETWDAVVLAIADYDFPKWPTVDGLQDLREKGLATHAQLWRGPRPYEGKHVVVIGNGNSSNDIAAQLAVVARAPVHRSIRNPPPSKIVSLPDSRIVDVAPVANYTLEPSDRITAHLTDGTTLEDIDHVVVGTGYAHDVPFLRVRDGKHELVPLIPPSIEPRRIPSLHRHILYAHNPTLAFIGTIVSAAPFPLSDVSSTWVALAWSARLPYPTSVAERLESEKERIAELQSIANAAESESSFIAYHLLGSTEFAYAKALTADVVNVQPGLGEVLAKWDEEQQRALDAMYPTKLESLRVARDEGWSIGNLPVDKI